MVLNSIQPSCATYVRNDDGDDDVMMMLLMLMMQIRSSGVNNKLDKIAAWRMPGESVVSF